jgi:hypothetical protein
VQVGDQAAPRHAARIRDAGGPVETEVQPVEVHERAPVALGVGAAAGHQPRDVGLTDDAAIDRRLRGEALRREAAAGDGDVHVLDRHPRHALGLGDRRPDRLLGGVEIGDDARLHPARALMADAEDAGLGRVRARLGRDQADDLGRADVDQTDGAPAPRCLRLVQHGLLLR